MPSKRRYAQQQAGHNYSSHTLAARWSAISVSEVVRWLDGAASDRFALAAYIVFCCAVGHAGRITAFGWGFDDGASAPWRVSSFLHDHSKVQHQARMQSLSAALPASSDRHSWSEGAPSG